MNNNQPSAIKNPSNSGVIETNGYSQVDSSQEQLISNQSPPSLSISTLAIRRHIGTLMLTLALIVVGIFFIFRLQVDLLPSITYPRIGLRMQVPGVSPDVAVEEITKPLEQALSATEGVNQVFSETREGNIRIDLFFEPGGNIDQALNDATATLNRVRDRLPEIAEQPRLFKFEPSQSPIYEFAIESPSLQDVDLRIFAEEELSRELSLVTGVASVNVSGGVDEEIRVSIDPKRLEALGISLNDILDSLENRNQDFSGGRLRGELGEPLTRTVGRFQSVREIVNLPLILRGNNSDLLGNERIYLQDVATIIDGTEDQRVFVSLNGKEALKISVQKQPDSNTITVINSLKNKLNELKENGLIPEDMVFVTTLDESVFIQDSLMNVASSGLIGTGLAALAVFLFLGSLRQTVIIVLAIPLATLTAVILMKLSGLSLNIFSLGGLALGVGIVVDNSIVMLENIAVNLEKTSSSSKSNLQNNTIISAQQVESALIASTATNLVSVLPFLLLGGVFSLLFNELILTISFAVAASLLLALTLVPSLAAQMLTISKSSNIANWWFLRLFRFLIDKITSFYGWLLKYVLKLRFFIVVLTMTLLTYSSLSMWEKINQEILPQINTGQANVIVQFPPGTTLENNRKIMQAIDEIILKNTHTEYVFTTAGGSLFGSNTTENLLRSSSTITLKPGTDIQDYIAEITQEVNKLNLVNTRVRIVPGRVRGIIISNSPVSGVDLDIILQGTNNKKLQETGKKLLRILDEKVTSVTFRPDADPAQQEIQIIPDWKRLSGLGLTTKDVGETIETAILGSVPTQLQRGERLVDIRVQLEENARENIFALENVPLFTNNQQTILVKDIGEIKPSTAPGQIQRVNQRNVFIIAGNLSKGASLSSALEEVESVLETVQLPPGVTLFPNTTKQANEDLINSLRIIGGLGAFLVFVVMAVQYNSLIDPLVIMFTVPLALTGGIFGLYITDTPVSAMVLVGAILLIGIVVNNAIIMVELANQLRTEFKLTYRSAILKAAPQRLRPILMTTITTVLGLYPLALGIGEGSEFLQPLGIVVFSGLSLATLLTLFIIPCFYVILHGLFRTNSDEQKNRLEID
jgi:CzcA family heavy metal efflux pump